MGFYLVEEGLSPNSSDLAGVIYQTKVPFCCSIQLFDLNVSKPAYELPPNICPDAVAVRKSYFMVMVIGFLSGKKIGRNVSIHNCFISGDL